jgi:hypothetical protein
MAEPVKPRVDDETLARLYEETVFDRVGHDRVEVSADDMAKQWGSDELQHALTSVVCEAYETRPLLSALTSEVERLRAVEVAARELLSVEPDDETMLRQADIALSSALSALDAARKGTL